MASMCETCKCSTYYNDELDMYSCENECPCCNDPDYESDGEMHYRIMKQIKSYIKLHLTSLEQDNDVIETELSKMVDMNSDEYESLDIENISLNGQIIATRHILNYIWEVE